MPFSYANPTSGPSAGGIGWFNFENLIMNPGDSVTGLTGTLNDGSTVTFDMSMTLVSGQPRQFDATAVPTYPLAQFGVGGYTGLTGNVAMYAVLADGNISVSAFTITNIVVKDPMGNPITNYTVLIGDGETTNLFEGIQGQTDGGNWNLFAVVGTGGFPNLTGTGTQTFDIVGNNRVGQMVAYVLSTQSPSQLVVTMTDQDPARTRQAFVIGFATTKLTLRKNIGQRIDPADQFVLNISGNPTDLAVTTGSENGIQDEFATIYATPGSPYLLNETMAAGSASLLSDYTQTVSASNATPAGTIPPAGSLPVSFTPALGDDVTYLILNAAPETFEKTVDKAYANIGEVLTYTVTVDNPNDFAVNNVLVTDATPEGTVYIGNLTVSAPYTGTDPDSGITITTIEPDESVTLTWQVQVNTFPPIPNPVPNYAQVTVPGGTSGMTNVVTTQVNTAFVSMIKMVDKVYAVTGDVITYTLTLRNAGNVPADNVVITDAVPAGTTFVPGSVTGAAGVLPTLTLNHPIPAGQNATVSFQVLVGDAIPNPNPIPNTAGAAYRYTVDPANPDGAQGTTQSNQVTTQINVARVTTEKTVDRSFANVGDVLTYKLTLQNTGNVPADQVTITDQIPSGTTFVPGSVTGALGVPPALTLQNPIPAGGNAVVTFQVRVGNTLPNPNPVSNSATAAFLYTVDPENPDGVPGTSTSNRVTTQINTANVTIGKTVDRLYADFGSILTYTLQLHNSGNVPANQVAITDTLPAGTEFVAGSLSGATGVLPLLTLTNPIPAGGSATVTFQVQVGNGIPDPNPIPNSASVTYSFTVDPENPDGVEGSGDSNTVYTQVRRADVSVTKAVDKAFAQPGDLLTYSLTLENTGNAAAFQTVITDGIPAGTIYVPGSLTGATGAPPTLTLTQPIPAGGAVTVSYRVKVTGIPSVNPIPNTASIAYVYTVDPQNPGGGSGTGRSNTVTTQISAALVSVTKSVDKKTAYIGDLVRYQLAVKNTGNVAAQNVLLTDPLPDGLSFVPGTLTAFVPITGTPGALSLSNPIQPGETVSISFQARVTKIPNPNPAVNQATAKYDYPVNPGEPNVPGTAVSNPVCTLVFRYRYSQQITDLVESAALEQAALAAVANAEGAKIQKMAAMSGVTEQELLCLNQSVTDLLDSITILETVIRQKLNIVSCQIRETCP